MDKAANDAGVLAPWPQKDTWLLNVLVPVPASTTEGESNNYSGNYGTYSRQDIFLSKGKIAQIIHPAGLEPRSRVDEGVEFMDCTERMVLPGFVNAHTHSYEHWARGLVCPLPLELWVLEMIRHESRGDCGWFGVDSFAKTPSWAMKVSALHCGVEALLSGCTALMDHTFVRNIDDIEATVNAYKALGIRAFVAPMLGDDAVPFSNYVPLVHDAQERNHQQPSGCSCGGLAANGYLRTEKGPHDPEKTKAVLDLWEQAVQKFHDPSNGIEIVMYVQSDRADNNFENFFEIITDTFVLI